MMAHKMVLAIFSFPILLIALGLGVFATTQSRNLYLPTSPVSLALSILLPLLTFMASFMPYASFQKIRPSASRTSSSRSLTLSSGMRPSNFSWLTRILPSSQLTHQAATLLTMILLALSGSAVSSSNGDLGACQLSTRWQHLFSAHNAAAIRAIQDAFACCGLRNPHDKGWPFAGGSDNNPNDACLRQHRGDPNRANGCEVPWTGRFRAVNGALLGSAVALLLVQVLRVYFDNVGKQAYGSRQKRGSRGGVQGVRNDDGDGVEDGVDEDAAVLSPGAGRYLDEPPAQNGQGGDVREGNRGQRTDQTYGGD